MPAPIWIAVLVKEPGSAKTRLSAALGPEARAALAEECALRALTAAREAGPTLAICAGPQAASLAARTGVEAIVEERPHGQNPAAQLGLSAAAARGAAGCLVLSSDLPLVEADHLHRLLDRAAAEPGPLCIAAAALGRAGTNALYLRPLTPFDLQFGDRSLPRFAAEAGRRGMRFLVHDDPALALDLDEPGDLAAWGKMRSEAGRRW
jgi:2-phospho-L-lactate guanylyltransferase